MHIPNCIILIIGFILISASNLSAQEVQSSSRLKLTLDKKIPDNPYIIKPENKENLSISSDRNELIIIKAIPDSTKQIENKPIENVNISTRREL
jgi:hypothetical protein